MEIQYFEFSTDVSHKECFDDEGNWLSFPDFDKVLWPIFLQKKEDVTSVLLFNNKRPKIDISKVGKLTKKSLSFNDQNMIDIGPLNEASTELLDYVLDLSMWDNFNIIYMCRGTDFLFQFQSQFPKPYGKVYTELVPFKDKGNDMSNVNYVVNSLANDAFIISIGGEHTLIFIGAKKELMRQLIKWRNKMD